MVRIKWFADGGETKSVGDWFRATKCGLQGLECESLGYLTAHGNPVRRVGAAGLPLLDEMG
jgi:hypothetical protein